MVYITTNLVIGTSTSLPLVSVDSLVHELTTKIPSSLQLDYSGLRD